MIANTEIDDKTSVTRWTIFKLLGDKSSLKSGQNICDILGNFKRHYLLS